MNDLFGALVSMCGLLCIGPLLIYGLPMFMIGRAWERGYRPRLPFGKHSNATAPVAQPTKRVTDPGYAARPAAQQTRPTQSDSSNR